MINDRRLAISTYHLSVVVIAFGVSHLAFGVWRLAMTKQQMMINDNTITR